MINNYCRIDYKIYSAIYAKYIFNNRNQNRALHMILYMSKFKSNMNCLMY